MTVTQFLKKLKHPQKEQILRLDRKIAGIRPGYKPKLFGDIVGYGAYDYRYPSGRSGSWFMVGYGARKGYISLQVMAVKDGVYMTELYKSRLGKVTTGKSCINIKDLDALDGKILDKLIRESFFRNEKIL